MTVMRGALAATSVRGARQALRHLAKDVDPPVARLVERDAHDVEGDGRDLDVHLQRGDALLGARHLEVHVAEMVLVAQDIGQHGVAAVLLDQAHGDAGARGGPAGSRRPSARGWCRRPSPWRTSRCFP
jgi:hypothetical protein